VSKHPTPQGEPPAQSSPTGDSPTGDSATIGHPLAEQARRLEAEAHARRAAEERRDQVEALNEQLRNQAVELELQTQEAQALAEELEEQATELEAANLELSEALGEAETAREAARRSEERYRLLFHANPMPAWVYDRDTLRFLTVNESAVREYGYSEEEFLAMTLEDIRPSEDVAALRAAVAASPNELHRLTGWRHRRKDGQLMDVELVSHGIVFDGHRNADLIIVVDVTERLRSEEERGRLETRLRQSEKLEAIGQLAGGVAHDFNNLLTVIASYSGLVLGELREDDPLRADVQQINGAAKRAAALTRQLLAFSRQQVLHLRPLTLNGVVEGITKLLRRLVRENIDIVTELDPEPYLVEADPGQLEQVIINLAVNSRDAMPAGGTLTIRTTNAELDERYMERHTGIAVEPGSYAMLSVSDTGSGMDAATQARIFEPFFTTKEPGVGTGLGLPTVYGIVKQSGGYIWVYSEPDRGSSFKVYLPRVTSESEVAHAARSGSAERRHGSETVLLVEDDDSLRQVACRALRKYGYAVIEARNGRDALELCAHHAGAIHVVVTDLVMPAMSGDELAERLAQRHPRMKVLLMSGYARDEAARRSIARAEREFIEKPFSGDALAARVRQILDA
jgi:PAS domain S-box-containing protein